MLINRITAYLEDETEPPTSGPGPTACNTVTAPPANFAPVPAGLMGALPQAKRVLAGAALPDGVRGRKGGRRSGGPRSESGALELVRCQLQEFGLGAMPTTRQSSPKSALRGHASAGQLDSHAHAKPWAWHPKSKV